MTESIGFPKQPGAAGPDRELLQQIGTSREIRRLAGTLIPEILHIWAESGSGAGTARKTARKSIARIAGNSIRKSFLDPQGQARAPALADLAVDPAWARKTADQLEILTGSVFDVLDEILVELKALDMEEKTTVLEAALSGLSRGRSGQLLTEWCRMAIDVHLQDPDFLARTLQPGFEQWLRNADLAELKEYVDTAAPGISRFVRMLNTALWEYPAKVITLLSLLPSLINIAGDSLLQVLRPLNEKASPDLLADILLAFMRETESRTTAELINELSEVLRRFHTGSALIGDPGNPQLPRDMNQWLENMAAALNVETFGKARTALIDIIESGRNAMTDVLAEHPELMAEGLRGKSTGWSAALRVLRRKLTALETALDREDLVTGAAKEAIEALDIQEAAEILNTTALLVNRFCDDQAPVMAEKASAFADALDTYEISEALTRMGEIAGQALLPAARTVTPHLINGFLSALAPADDELEETVQPVRDRLKAFLTPREEK